MSNQLHFSNPHHEDCCFHPLSDPNDAQQMPQATFAAQPPTLIGKDSREERLKLPNTADQVKIRERHRRAKKLLTEKVSAVEESAGGEGSSSAKKLDHNARERMRRMRLNASYLALRALLPDPRRSKKRWTAPALVDRVLKYIPELENEIEKLKQTKDIAKNRHEQQQVLINQEVQALTVSVNEVENGEAIVQICKEPQRDDEAFSRILENMEAEGVCIRTASTLSICQNRICYQFLIQWDANVLGGNYIRKLRDKVIYWLS